MRLVIDDEMWVVGKNPANRELLRDFMKRRREEMGLTVGALETVSGVTHPGYHTFETGKTKISYTALRIMPHLGIDLFMLPTLGGKTE